MRHTSKPTSTRALSALGKTADITAVRETSIDSLDHDGIVNRRFRFFALEAGGRTLLLACYLGGNRLDWITARNLADSTLWLYDVVVVSADDLLAPERSALIAAGLSYIVVDREAFIPDLHVNTSGRAIMRPPKARLSTSTQAVLTHALNSGRYQYEISSMLSELAIPCGHLKCVSRELVDAGIAAVDRQGSQAQVEMDECSVTWAMSEPLLSNPVIEVQRIRPRVVARLGQLRVAGEDALSRIGYGVQDYPLHLAMHQRLVRSLARSLVPCDAKDFALVEIWDRCPAKLSPQDTRVDPISLYLSRRDHATLAELSRLRRLISDRW